MRNIFYCVERARMDLDEFHTRRYRKMVQYGIDVFAKLQLKIDKKVKVYYFTPNDAMQAILPPDFDFYTKIGVPLGGKVFTLTLNPDMALNRSIDDCGHEITEVIADCSCYNNWWNYGYGWIPHYRGGQFVGEMFSVGGGINPNGYFRVDKQYRLIQVMNVPRIPLIMEYVGTGGDDGETIIPNIATPSIVAGIHYWLTFYDKRANESDKDRKFNAYCKELSDYKEIEHAPTLPELLDTFYQTSHFKRT